MFRNLTKRKWGLKFVFWSDRIFLHLEISIYVYSTQYLELQRSLHSLQASWCMECLPQMKASPKQMNKNHNHPKLRTVSTAYIYKQGLRRALKQGYLNTGASWDCMKGYIRERINVFKELHIVSLWLAFLGNVGG